MFTKEHIIEEIKRTAQENGGQPLGTVKFEKETGIRQADIVGKYWKDWSAAVEEAGLEPLKLQGPIDEEDIIMHLASLTLELGRWPVSSELKMKRMETSEFPSHSTFDKLGKKRDKLLKLQQYGEKHENDALVHICNKELLMLPELVISEEEESVVKSESTVGCVYMFKFGRTYKIGRTKSVDRREREFAIQLPEKPKLIHQIKTDDPAGIEAYWHKRFKDRRKGGEWFELTKEDVALFKRRKFM